MSFTSERKESSPVLNYSTVFPFEADFDPVRNRQWIFEHRHQTFYLIGVYLLFIFTTQAFMKNRPRLELKLIIIPWNISLAVFSIIGLCRTFPELLHELKTFGFIHSVCDPNFVAHDKVTAFWTWAFIISKVAELGDTLFVVFRKHQLIFLHWYHHLVTLIFTWYAYSEHAAFLRWVTVANLFPHSLMYTYYAMCALRIRLPKFIAISISAVQIIQMIIGSYVCYTGYTQLRKSRFCHAPKYIVFFGWFMYGSYLVLFVWFFYKAYLSPKPQGKKSE